MSTTKANGIATTVADPGRVIEAVLPPVSPTAPAAAALTPPRKPRLARISASRELSSRIFHAAFYSADELEQIVELLHFDRAFYRTEYPGVAATGVDPILDFLARGINEMRLPASPVDAPKGDWLEYLLGFDPVFYAARYPDTGAAPHGHFIRHGARERRLPFDLNDNYDSDRLLREVLDNLDVTCPDEIETRQRHDAGLWRAVPDALTEHVARSGLTPKRYRNNFWLGMAVGLLAQCRFGAAACCYNFFFNYYIPVSFLGNTDQSIIGTGCVFTILEGLARSGAVVAAPALPRGITITEPVFLNRPNATSGPSRQELPKPVYGVLRNVEAIGATSLMIQDGHVVLYDHLEHGERAREVQSGALLHVVGQNCSFRIPAKTRDVDEAFSMLQDHSFNYHHWLLEIMPRYLLALRNGMPPDTPLLVDADIKPQMREMLHLICRGEVPIIDVAHGMSIRVGKMHVASDVCVGTVHTEHPPERGDCVLSPAAIEMLRELASPHFADDLGKYENVLIVRQNVNFRRLVNRGVLEQAMKPLGLWSFDPGQASWTEQVRVFSNARLIVSEAGAALANLTFCRPGTNVIVLVQGHPHSNYYFLAQFADLVGIRVHFFECLRLVGSHWVGVQEDMIAPVSQLADWVRRFQADPNYRTDEPDADPANAREPRSTTIRVGNIWAPGGVGDRRKKPRTGGRVALREVT